MAYTEIKQRKDKGYYYRVISVRRGNKVSKKRIYLGKNLGKEELSKKEKQADEKLKAVKESKNITRIKPKIVSILKKHKVRKAGIFGSYATGKQKKMSDIDLLVEVPKDMSLLGLSGLKIELEKSLGKKVDLVSYKFIHPCIKERILKDEIKIL